MRGIWLAYRGSLDSTRSEPKRQCVWQPWAWHMGRHQGDPRPVQQGEPSPPTAGPEIQQPRRDSCLVPTSGPKENNPTHQDRGLESSLLSHSKAHTLC